MRLAAMRSIAAWSMPLWTYLYRGNCQTPAVSEDLQSPWGEIGEDVIRNLVSFRRRVEIGFEVQVQVALPVDVLEGVCDLVKYVDTVVVCSSRAAGGDGGWRIGLGLRWGRRIDGG